jgi:GST-like protein
MFQMGGVGPMFGQLGFFHKFAGREVADPLPRKRYADEARRLLAVLDGRLAGREWIMGEDYTIADVATWPWVRALDFYEAWSWSASTTFPTSPDGSSGRSPGRPRRRH